MAHTHTTTNIASHKHISIMRFFERTKDIHRSLFLGRGKSMSYAQCQPWICHERRSTEKQYNCENIFALLLSPTYEHFTQNTSVCWCRRDKLSNKSHQTGNCFSYETMSEACLQPACMVLCVQISVPYNMYIYIYIYSIFVYCKNCFVWKNLTPPSLSLSPKEPPADHCTRLARFLTLYSPRESFPTQYITD